MIISATDSKGDGRTKEIFSQIGERAGAFAGSIMSELVRRGVSLGSGRSLGRRGKSPWSRSRRGWPVPQFGPRLVIWREGRYPRQSRRRSRLWSKEGSR